MGLDNFYQLKNDAETIRQETQDGRNDAERVGGWMVDMAEAANNEFSKKGKPKGYASLDENGKIPRNEIPDSTWMIHDLGRITTTGIFDSLTNSGTYHYEMVTGSKDNGTWKTHEGFLYVIDSYHQSDDMWCALQRRVEFNARDISILERKIRKKLNEPGASYLIETWQEKKNNNYNCFIINGDILSIEYDTEASYEFIEGTKEDNFETISDRYNGLYRAVAGQNPIIIQYSIGDNNGEYSLVKAEKTDCGNGKYKVCLSLIDTDENQVIKLNFTETKDEDTNELSYSFSKEIFEMGKGVTENPETESKLNELYQEVFPVTMTVSGGGVYEVGTTQDITVSWTIKQNGVTVVPESITVDGTPVPVSSTSYTIQGVDETMTIPIVAEGAGYSLMELVQVYFAGQSYYGVIDLEGTNVDDFDVTHFENMDSVLKTTKALTYTGITMANMNIAYAYPKSMGGLSSIKDVNGFQYINSYTRLERVYNNVDYWVYILTEPATATGFMQVFS